MEITLTITEPETALGQSTLADHIYACLQRLFDRLRRAGIPFCVLRNRDRIPAGLIDGSDVDVLVPPGISPHRLLGLVADLAPAHVATHRSTIEIYFDLGPIFLHVDLLVSDREWRGARYLENQRILAYRKDDEGIPVASPVHQAFCAWFSHLARRKSFKARYVPLIEQAARDCPVQMHALLHHAFGRQLGIQLMQLAQSGKLHLSNSLAGKCRSAIWLRAVAKRPVATLAGLVHHCACELRQYVRPAGMAVAILGPDGAGKSTVCAALQNASRASLPFRRVETNHLYQRVLPLLSELRHGRIRHKRESGPVNDPHGKRPSNGWVSAFRLAYFLLDLWLNRLIFSQRKLAHNSLLLHDRHVMEIVVDPRRFRYGGPAWLARWAARLIPQPDLVILLDAPAEVLQSRKQEVPLAETRRQLEAYRSYVNRLSNGRIVDASQPVEQIVEDVRQAIRHRLASRTTRRFFQMTDAP